MSWIIGFLCIVHFCTALSYSKGCLAVWYCGLYLCWHASFQFVPVCLRIQVNPQNKSDFTGISPERAFGDFIFAHVILHLVVMNFMGWKPFLKGSFSKVRNFSQLMVTYVQPYDRSCMLRLQVSLKLTLCFNMCIRMYTLRPCTLLTTVVTRKNLRKDVSKIQLD